MLCLKYLLAFIVSPSSMALLSAILYIAILSSKSLIISTELKDGSLAVVLSEDSKSS